VAGLGVLVGEVDGGVGALVAQRRGVVRPRRRQLRLEPAQVQLLALLMWFGPTTKTEGRGAQSLSPWPETTAYAACGVCVCVCVCVLAATKKVFTLKDSCES